MIDAECVVVCVCVYFAQEMGVCFVFFVYLVLHDDIIYSVIIFFCHVHYGFFCSFSDFKLCWLYTFILT